jgi:hypothetical protein
MLYLLATNRMAGVRMGIAIIMFFMFLMLCVVILPSFWPKPVDESTQDDTDSFEQFEDFETFEELVKNDVAEIDCLIRSFEDSIQHCEMLKADMLNRNAPPK